MDTTPKFYFKNNNKNNMISNFFFVFIMFQKIFDQFGFFFSFFVHVIADVLPRFSCLVEQILILFIYKYKEYRCSEIFVSNPWLGCSLARQKLCFFKFSYIGYSSKHDIGVSLEEFFNNGILDQCEHFCCKIVVETGFYAAACASCIKRQMHLKDYGKKGFFIYKCAWQ